MHRIRTLALVCAGATYLATLAGCAGCQDEGTVSATMLMRFADCDDLRGYVVDGYTEMLVQSRYGYYGWGWEDDLDGGGPPANEGDGPSDWSETNVQEQGVDEPDLVKTDGESIFVAQRGELTVVDSWPAEQSSLLASVPIAGDPFALFLRNGRAAVLSRAYGWDDEPGILDEYDHGTRVTVVDVSDPAAPVVIREVELEGYYVDARMIDGQIYVVLTRWYEFPWELWDQVWNDELGLPDIDWEASELEREVAAAEARAILRPIVEDAVAAMDLDQLLPRYADGGPDDLLLACTDVYHPTGVSAPTVLTVAHLDIEDGPGAAVAATGLMAEGWTVYASREHLYVAQGSWWWWWGWGALEASTHIHQFALDGQDTVYQASGAVDGWLLNRFSMGEHDGHLRAATTDFNLWGWWDEDDEEADPPANNVFVLERDGASLDVVGEVRGIAPDEQIYAARFQGDRGYLVTFEQIDPLFTLDLSDPTDPRVIGELEVPGYSSYLHPVGMDHILAIGMDGTEDGQITGLAISLFDISDFANPALVDRYTLANEGDWSYSEALWDPHAFTYYHDVLAVPAYSWSYDDDEGFSGLLLLDVDLAGGLTEIGRIDHAELVAESECLYGDPGYEEDVCEEYYWYAWMRRGVMIDDNVYSVSDYGIKVNELQAPDNELARVLFWPDVT